MCVFGCFSVCQRVDNGDTLHNKEPGDLLSHGPKVQYEVFFFFMGVFVLALTPWRLVKVLTVVSMVLENEIEADACMQSSSFRTSGHVCSLGALKGAGATSVVVCTLVFDLISTKLLLKWSFGLSFRFASPKRTGLNCC